jgi:hypothetical protein
MTICRAAFIKSVGIVVRTLDVLIEQVAKRLPGALLPRAGGDLIVRTIDEIK